MLPFKVGIPFIAGLGTILNLSLVINDAETEGLLKPNTNSMIFEGTVGSTGISITTVVGFPRFMVEFRRFNCTPLNVYFNTLGCGAVSVMIREYVAMQANWDYAKGVIMLVCHFRWVVEMCRLFVAIIIPDDVAEDKVKALLCLGAKVEKVRPASIVDKKQVRGRMLSCHHSYFIEIVCGMSLPHRPLLAVHDEQNLAKQRAIEFGQTAVNDPEDDLLVSSQTQSTILINHRKGATSLDLELENKPRGFFADQFEVICVW